jgi:hypothetical protein
VGNRTAMTDATGVTTSTYDAANRLPSVGGVTNPGPTLYLVGHETLARWDGSAWAYHLSDALGSMRQTADSAGAVTESREWAPYGVELALSGVEGVGAAHAGLGYTGEWWDGDGERFLEEWRRWNARLLPITQSCVWCDFPRGWPSQFSSLVSGALYSERNVTWWWYENPWADGAPMETNVEGVFALEEFGLWNSQH